VSLAISGGNANLAVYSSREGTIANRPQLVLTLQSALSTPLTGFSGRPLSGTAPLTVQFNDLSSGTPSSWRWSFGDTSSSTVSNPEHTYAEPGLYPVSLVTSNASGSDTLTRTAYVQVTAPIPRAQTFHPIADSGASEADPVAADGHATVLRVRNEVDRSFQSLLKFDLAGLGGLPTSARLRLFVTDESNSGGSLYLVSSRWSESDLSWSSKPIVPANPIATAGAAPLGTWVELDVSSAILGPGTVSFALAGGMSNAVHYSSREGMSPPELVVQTSVQTVREKR
jgi:PKD repeat protein